MKFGTTDRDFSRKFIDILKICDSSLTHMMYQNLTKTSKKVNPEGVPLFPGSDLKISQNPIILP